MTFKPVSFRLEPDILWKLDLIAEVLDKSKSLVMKQIILEAHKSILNDYPNDIGVAEAKLVKKAKKGNRGKG